VWTRHIELVGCVGIENQKKTSSRYAISPECGLQTSAELFGIHLGADFRVGFHFVDAFDHIAVAVREMMQNVALVGAAPGSPLSRRA